MKSSAQPIAFERFVFWLMLLAAIALGLLRINIVDTPWHLLTARWAFEHGHYPVTNTFSYTFPGYPLFQQYPVYQTILYGVYQAGGFAGLSILHCVGWLSIFVLWIRWGSDWRQAMVLHLPWMFCLWCLQQRMTMRPDLATCILFLATLHLIDGYRRGARWTALLLPLVQWLMANSHQLFTVGLAAQAIFLIHLMMVRLANGRFGIATMDRHLAIWPIACALAVSAGVCLLTPLGLHVLEVSAHTAGSLYHHREDVTEFAYFYNSPWVLTLVTIAVGFGIAGLWISRKSWQPMEVGLWIMSGVLAAAAMRGLVFFGPLSVGIFARAWSRRFWQGDQEIAPAKEADAAKPLSAVDFGRIGMVGVTLGLCLVIFLLRWVSPPRKLGGVQPGVGKSLGDWPDQALAFLRENPPPGRMLNLGWFSGNALLWGLYPEKEIFVDPRFETYPREFLIRAIRAERDDETLHALIKEFSPQWLVAEVRLSRVVKRVRKLLDSGEWRLVYGDTVFLVLVRRGPDTKEYLKAHEMEVEELSPTDWLTQYPDLLRQQQLRMGQALRILGAEEMGSALLDAAAP